MPMSKLWWRPSRRTTPLALPLLDHLDLKQRCRQRPPAPHHEYVSAVTKRRAAPARFEACLGESGDGERPNPGGAVLAKLAH